MIALNEFISEGCEQVDGSCKGKGRDEDFHGAGCTRWMIMDDFRDDIFGLYGILKFCQYPTTIAGVCGVEELRVGEHL